MFSFLSGRVVSGAITLIGVVIMVFFLARLTGSPVDLYFPEGGTDAQIQAFNQAHGLDEPLPTQFFIFMKSAIQGDFGDSIWQQRPAIEAALAEMPMTLALGGIAMLVSIVTSIILGSIAAAYRFRQPDRIITTLSLTAGSIPVFWFAIVTILVFSIKLNWLPTSGSYSWQSWILPVATVSLSPIGVLTQVVRGAMIDVLTSGYVRNARARGFGQLRLIYRHSLRNAALPIIAVAGDIAASMLNGAVIVSVVFAFPGIGRLIVGAITARDFPVLQASMVLVGLAIIILNLIIDVIYMIVDPRVRLS